MELIEMEKLFACNPKIFDWFFQKVNYYPNK